MREIRNRAKSMALGQSPISDAHCADDADTAPLSPERNGHIHTAPADGRTDAESGGALNELTALLR